jgi:hypothetical protein
MIRAVVGFKGGGSKLRTYIYTVDKRHASEYESKNSTA